MQWSNGANAGFSNAPAEMLYLPVDESDDRPSVLAQDADPASLLNRVRTLITIRKSLQALDADADFKVIYAQSGKLPFVYSRSKGGQSILVAINPSNQQTSVQLPGTLFDSAPEGIDAPQGTHLVKNGTHWDLVVLTGFRSAVQNRVIHPRIVL